MQGKPEGRYRNAWQYSYGYGLVQLDNGMFAYRDKKGNLSEEYSRALPYMNGFGIVKLKNGEFANRDMDGNLFSGSEYSKMMEHWKDKIEPDTEGFLN